MNNELNDNSTTPEKATTHHYDKSGALIITDVLQYFRDSIESPDIYSFRLQFAESENANFSVIYANKPDVLSARLTAEQSEILWSHVSEFQYEMKNASWHSIKIQQESAYAPRSFILTKKSRVSAEIMIQQKSIQQEAYDFLTAAYSAGINILIEGKTYSGKSRFLNTLMDSAKDYNRTVLLNKFPEMMFGNDHREITEIRSDNPAVLIRQAIRMTPDRVVMDDVFVDEITMKMVVAAAMAGTQFVSTGYTRSPTKSTSETDHLSSYYVQHPYELRVNVDISWNDDGTKLEFNVLSIKQIVHQKIGESDTTSNRLLFDREHKIAAPTRTLRRKIESATRWNTEAGKMPAVNKPVLAEKPTPAFVSITQEEKTELDQARATLREHFKKQSVFLRDKFREIERILEKF